MTKQEFLAMSLPYGLKCKTLDIEVEDFDTMFYFQEFEANEKSIYNETYPYLHPLSDLTKEIEHNGEKFVPMVKLSCYAKEQTNHGQCGIKWGVISTFPFLDIIKLIEWHFNLMDESEQFIDVNTLPENPYK